MDDSELLCSPMFWMDGEALCCAGNRDITADGKLGVLVDDKSWGTQEYVIG